MSQNPYLRLLTTNKNYRSLFFATAVSLAGDWFNVIAVVVLLGQLHSAGALEIGSILIIKQLPLVVFAAKAGAIADRLNRRTIMIVSDVLRFLVVLTLLLAPYLESQAPVYILLVIQSSLSAFFEPARSAILPDIVDAKDLRTANALGAMLWSTMLIAGSTLGGLATEFFGWEVAVTIDAFSYLASAALLLKIQYVPLQHTTGTSEGSFSEFLKLLSANPRLKAVACIKGIYGIGGAMYLLITLFGQKVYTVGESSALGITMLYVARGTGAFFGPFIARSLFPDTERHHRLAVYYGLISASLFYMLLAVASDWWWACVCVFFAHMSASLIWVYSTLLLQLNTTRQMRGRAFGFELGLFTFTSSLSMLLYGAAIDLNWLDIPQASFFLGALWIVPTAWWLWAQSLWSDNKPLPE